MKGQSALHVRQGPIECPPGTHLEGGVCVPDSPTLVGLSVSAVDQNGAPTPPAPNGLFTTLYDSTGTVVQQGYSPITFQLLSGVTYELEIADFQNYTFLRWQDGVSTRRRPVTIAAATALVAVFSTGPIQPGDTVAPTFAITSPLRGAQLPYGQPIVVRGTASDNVGLVDVKVRLKEPSPSTTGSAFIPVTPRAPGDYSEWSVTLGPFPSQTEAWTSIYGRALDAAGNVGQDTVHIAYGTGGGGGGGAISAVQNKYWHYMVAAGSDNILVQVGYTGSDAIVGQQIRHVARVYDAVTSAYIAERRESWTGKLTDNLGVNINIPTGSPNRVRVEIWFINSSGDRISPILRQEMTKGTYSGTFKPVDLPTLGQPVTVRPVYYHYNQLADGNYQLQIVCTYRAHSSIIGRGIKGAMDIFVAAETTPQKTIRYSNSIPATDDGVIIIKYGAVGLVPPNASPVRLSAYMIDGTNNNILSNRAEVEVRQGARWP